MGLPVIDIAALTEGGTQAAARQAAGGIDEACRTYGFFYAEGHGIPDAAFDRLEAASRAFFDLPDGIKALIGMDKGGPAWRGWFPLEGELTSGRPDRKEGLYLGEELGIGDPRVDAGWPLHGPNLWPEQVPQLRAAVNDWLEPAILAAAALMRGVALGLGLGPDHFAAGITRDPTLLFRIFHYPADLSEDGEGKSEAGGFGVGEHSDYGLLTLLGQDRQGGLEVRTTSGWITVPPRGRALVINVGDMLERLTLGRYRSAPHRVINRSGLSRLSYPLFYDPGFAARIDPLPIDATTRDETRWDDIDLHGRFETYGDYLTAKISKVFPDLARDKL